MKTLLQRFMLSLATLMLIGFVGTSNAHATVGCDGDMTVYLVDSYGAPLAGGMLEYKDGGWMTAYEMSTGMFCVDTDLTTVELRMTFCGSELYVDDVPTDAPYTFQTVMVTFELRKRTGDLGYKHGAISFIGYGPNPFATTDAGGLAYKELLPREYDFRMKFRGGRGDITQDISVDPVVTWQMARMLVQVNKSDGTRGLNGVGIKYKGYAMETFGTTGTSENGRARRDLLPGTYKFTLKYKGGKYIEEDFVVVDGDNELYVDGVAVTVDLYDDLPLSYGIPVDGGAVQNIGVTGNDFGTTGDDGTGTGSVTHDLLPGLYSFIMNYDGDSDEQLDIDCSSATTVTFMTSDLKSSVLAASDVNVAAYPNPFVGNATFAFELDADQHVSIEVYDLTGKRVESIYEGNLTEGTHKMNWDAQDVNSGLYIFKLTTEHASYTQRLVKN